MAKRRTLTYDSEGLAESLQRSAGQGVDALFSRPSPPRSQQTKKPRPVKPSKPARRRSEPPRKRAMTVGEGGVCLPQPKTGTPASTTRASNQAVATGHHNSDTTVPGHRDTTTPRGHGFVTPRMVESVRKAVKQIGKEAATHRFTAEEKQTIADLVYTYGRQGYRTSENEIARIALNWLVRDYHENGTQSVLERVLKALKE